PEAGRPPPQRRRALPVVAPAGCSRPAAVQPRAADPFAREQTSTRDASFPERSRSRSVRAAHVGLRLLGLARARLGFRRAQPALAASGAALAAAMLALTLAMQAGVEDATFAEQLRHPPAPNPLSPQNAFS